MKRKKREKGKRKKREKGKRKREATYSVKTNK